MWATLIQWPVYIPTPRRFLTNLVQISSVTFLADVFKLICHDDIIKWKHFPRYWHFVRGNHRSPVNSPHKGQWRGHLMFALICAWTEGCVNISDAGDLRRNRTHYDVTVMSLLVILVSIEARVPIFLWDLIGNLWRYLPVANVFEKSNGQIAIKKASLRIRPSTCWWRCTVGARTPAASW